MNQLHTLALAAAALLLLTVANPAASQSPSTGGNRGMALPIDPQLLNDLPEIKGIVSWKLLGQVKTAQVGQRFVPEFAAEIRKLDQQDVKLQGYMMPIAAGERSVPTIDPNSTNSLASHPVPQPTSRILAPS